MKCRYVQTHLAVFSVGDLSEKTYQELNKHLMHCPLCRGQWAAFEQTLDALSTLSQPVLEDDQSRSMWHTCRRNIQDRSHFPRPLLRHSSLNYKSEGAMHRWYLQPQVGWAALGGAVALFIGVWFLAPQAPPQSVLAYDVVQTAPSETVAYQLPPRDLRPMVNQHAGMSFDPFTDHVGSTMISRVAGEE